MILSNYSYWKRFRYEFHDMGKRKELYNINITHY